MKNLVLLALCSLSFSFAPVQAETLATEPAATAYLEIPLSSTRTGKTQSAFGLRMDQVVHDSVHTVLPVLNRDPVVDFRFNSTGMQGVFVRGINMANPAIMKLGIEEAVLWIVGGAALGAVALVVEANDHGGSTVEQNNCAPGLTLNACFSLNVGCC
ncbi:MAG: hypothetical protein ABL877_05305 [Thiobacillus sp.]